MTPSSRPDPALIVDRCGQPIPQLDKNGLVLNYRVLGVPIVILKRRRPGPRSVARPHARKIAWSPPSKASQSRSAGNPWEHTHRPSATLNNSNWSPTGVLPLTIWARSLFCCQRSHRFDGRGYAFQLPAEHLNRSFQTGHSIVAGVNSDSRYAASETMNRVLELARSSVPKPSRAPVDAAQKALPSRRYVTSSVVANGQSL